MARRGWFTYENGLLLLLGLTFGLAFFDRNAVGFLTPYIVKDLGLNNTQVGMLGSGLALTWAISAYVLGSWSDRLGVRKPFLIGIVLIFSACSVISGLANSFGMLLAARIVMGAAEGPFLPICLAIMMVESSIDRRGANAGILQTVFSAFLGYAVAPIVLVALADAYDWRTAFYLAGVPGLVCAFIIWKVVREPDPKAIAALSPDTHGGAGAPRMGLFTMLRIRNIWLCCAIATFMVAWLLIAGGFLPLFLTQVRHFSAPQMSVLMSVLGLSAALFAFIAPLISDRIGRRPVMIVLCLMSVGSPLAAIYFDGPVVVLGGLMFIGWVGTGAFPLFMGVVPAETISFRLAATSMGLVILVGELLGGFIGPTLAGWAADRTSLTTPIAIAAGCALIAGVLAFFLEETAPSRVGRRGTGQAAAPTTSISAGP
ncbi:MAG: MFS transporter [Pseudomonadota bacterium]